MIPNTSNKLIAVCATLALLAACKPGTDSTTEKTATSPETKRSSAETATVPPGSEGYEFQDFRGVGLAVFGDSEQKLRKAHSQPMRASTPADGSTCHYLYPGTDKDAKRSIAYMFEDDKFVRLDVYDDSQAAPENVRVGDSTDSVTSKFAGRIEQLPHKYIEKALILTVAPKDKSAAHLIFEIDDKGKVISWRAGVPPQVFYVEGCS